MKMIVSLLIALSVPLAYSQGLSGTPVHRIETGWHTSAVQSIDAAERYLVSRSQDKTVPVWELASGQVAASTQAADRRRE